MFGPALLFGWAHWFVVEKFEGASVVDAREIPLGFA
jgi:hypothetical protein